MLVKMLFASKTRVYYSAAVANVDKVAMSFCYWFDHVFM